MAKGKKNRKHGRKARKPSAVRYSQRAKDAGWDGSPKRKTRKVGPTLKRKRAQEEARRLAAEQRQRAVLWTKVEDALFIAQKLVFRSGAESWGLTGLNPGERWELEASFLEGRLGDVLKEAHGVIGDGAYLLEAEGVQVIR